MFSWLADWVITTPLTDVSRTFLGSASVVPPLVQTIHLTGVILLTACVVFPSLSVVTSTSAHFKYQLMRAYCLRGFIAGMVLMLMSGLPFLLARPHRYATNPVFAIKAALLVLALPLAVLILRRYQRSLISDWPERLLALLTLMLWVALILAGRWIAYSEYLFWPEDY